LPINWPRISMLYLGQEPLHELRDPIHKIAKQIKINFFMSNYMLQN